MQGKTARALILVAAAALAFGAKVYSDRQATPQPTPQAQQADISPAPVAAAAAEPTLPTVVVQATAPSEPAGPTNALAAVFDAPPLIDMPRPNVPRSAVRYRSDLVRIARSEWGLNAPVATFAAQVHQESAWNPQAVSRVGARGLGQFMPGTATWWCERTGLAAADCQPHNPSWALRSLVGYDKYLYDRSPARYGDHDRMWVALRSYNGGLGHWQAEARATGAREPTREQVDAACGKARRAQLHCKENLGYPRRILQELQPRYATWGPGL